MDNKRALEINLEKHLDPEDECKCGHCHLSFAEKYQEKIICTSEIEKYAFEEQDESDWESIGVDYESFTDEDVELLKRIQNENHLSDEEMEEIERLFKPVIERHEKRQAQKKPEVKEKEELEWAQLICSHPKDKVIINEAGGTKFRYCKACKKDLGDVK